MTAAVVVRPASTADAAGIAHVSTAAWREAYAGLLSADFLARRVVTEDAWQQRLTELEDKSSVYVAVHAADVIGFATCGPPVVAIDEDDADDLGMLYAIYVLADWWGNGVGYRLHEAVLAGLHAAGYREAVLYVLEGNKRAEAFYRRQGWTDDHSTREDTMDGQVLVERRYRLRPLRSRP